MAEAGGAEVLLLDILSGLREHGADAALFVFGEGPLPGLAEARGLPVHRGRRLSFRDPASVAVGAAQLRRTISARRPDLLHASHPKGQLIGRIASAGRPLVHSTQLYEGPAERSPSCVAAAHLRGHRFAITDETAAAYTARYPWVRPQVIYPGTDIPAFRERADRGDGPAVWSTIDPDGCRSSRVLMAGRLQRFKGPFDLVDAAEHVLAEEPGAVFLIAGPHSPREPGLRDELVAEIARRRLTKHVGLVGRLGPDDLAAAMAAATLLAHPAAREPFGLVLIEALSVGTPVIAYAADGPRRILANGGGELVPIGDSRRLATAILGALRDEGLRARWATEARSAADRYDIRATVTEYLRALTELASTVAAPCESETGTAPGPP